MFTPSCLSLIGVCPSVRSCLCRVLLSGRCPRGAEPPRRAVQVSNWHHLARRCLVSTRWLLHVVFPVPCIRVYLAYGALAACSLAAGGVEGSISVIHLRLLEKLPYGVVYSLASRKRCMGDSRVTIPPPPLPIWYGMQLGSEGYM